MRAEGRQEWRSRRDRPPRSGPASSGGAQLRAMLLPRVGNSTPRPENQAAKGERGHGRGSGGEVEAGSRR